MVRAFHTEHRHNLGGLRVCEGNEFLAMKFEFIPTFIFFFERTQLRRVLFERHGVCSEFFINAFSFFYSICVFVCAGCAIVFPLEHSDLIAEIH